MRFKCKIAVLSAVLASAALLASCDITPKSPVLAGDTGESSNEAVGTVLPDPPPAHPPSHGSQDKKKSQPDTEPPKTQDGQAPEKGSE